MSPIWDGGWPDNPEDEREAMPWETEGTLDFLPEDETEWGALWDSWDWLEQWAGPEYWLSKGEADDEGEA